MIAAEHMVYVFAKLDKNRQPCSPVKVGRSGSTNSRFATIQTACPFELSHFYEFECPNREWAQDLERSFHATQSAYRMFGEWFDFHPVVAVHLLCIGYRALASLRIKDPYLLDGGLDKAGVLWAEKRFSLNAVGVLQ